MVSHSAPGTYPVSNVCEVKVPINSYAELVTQGPTSGPTSLKYGVTGMYFLLS